MGSPSDWPEPLEGLRIAARPAGSPPPTPRTTGAYPDADRVLPVMSVEGDGRPSLFFYRGLS